MTAIPQTVAAALRKRGITYKVGRHGDLQVCCPFCVERGESADRRYRLGINLQTGEGHCFNCGWHRKKGAVQGYFKRVHLGTIRVGQVEAPEQAPQVLKMPAGCEPLLDAANACDLAGAAMAYLRERGVSPTQLRRHRVQYCYSGKMAYRVVFPVYDGRALRMLVGRVIQPHIKLRYLNTPGEKYLWGVTTSAEAQCVLSEGIFKALALEKMCRRDGFASYALLGHNLTPRQLDQLERLGVTTVAVWPDPDPVGLRGALEIYDKLSALPKMTVLWVPPATAQADEISLSERQQLWARRGPLRWSDRAQIKVLVSKK